MEKRYSEIIGTTVIAQEDNSEIGVIKQVLIDTDRGKIVAFVLNVFSSEVVLPIDIIQCNDVLLVHSKKDLVPSNETERVNKIKIRGDYLLTKRVETENGIYIGKIYDYTFDNKMFELRNFYVRKAFFFFFFVHNYLISSHNIIEVQNDRVIVKDSVLKELDFKFKKKLSADFN